MTCAPEAVGECWFDAAPPLDVPIVVLAACHVQETAAAAADAAHLSLCEHFRAGLAPLSTAAWAAAAHAGRPEAVYQTGQFAPFCLMRTPVCSSFLFGIGEPCVMALGMLLLVSTVIHVAGATGVVW